MVAPVPYGLAGLRYRPTALPGINGAAQAQGLQYRPPSRPGAPQGSPWRPFIGGGLQAIGAGLMAAGSGESFGPAFTGALQNAEQAQRQRAQDARDEQLFDLHLDQAEAERQAAEEEQRKKAARDAAIDSLPGLDDATKAMLKAIDAKPSYGDLVPKPAGPQSSLAKLKADLDAGRIDRPTYDAMVRKETYVAPSAGSGLTERQRNAAAAGLTPGTPEYQRYILGRDDEGAGPFGGTALDAQAMNMLLTGDPNSPQYAAAYAHLAQPKVQFDPTTNRLVTVSPDLSWATAPQQRGQGAPLPMMPSTGNRPGPTVQNAQALPQPAPSIPGAETMQVPGATITSTPGTGLSAADRTKLRTVKAEAQSIRDALTRFRDVVKSSNWRDDLSAAAGGTTEGGRRLNSAWTNAAIMTKAEALFNLGVLNGPDLSVIQGTLPNPATMSGLFTSEGAAAAAVDEVLRLIDSKVAAFEAQFGGTVAPTTPSPTLPSGGTRVDSLPAGNWQ